MKHWKYLSALLASSIVLSSGFSSAWALDMSSGLDNLINTSITNAINPVWTGMSNDSNDNGQSNSDYVVKESEVKKGDFTLSNGNLSVDGVYYVYGNLTVSNADVTVKGKLKVTGNLIVSNGDIINNGRIYVLGKKKVSNGNASGTPAKLSAELTKYDPILRADLDKDEEAKVSELITTMKKNVEALKIDIRTAVAKDERIEGIKEKIRNEKEAFFQEMEQYIQAEDKAAFEEIKKADTENTEGFLATFKRVGGPSEALRKQVVAIVDKFPADKKSTTLERLIKKLDALLVNSALGAKKANLIINVKEVLEDGLDKIATDDVNNLMDETTTSGTILAGSGNTDTATVITGSGNTSITTASGTTISQ